MTRQAARALVPLACSLLLLMAVVCMTAFLVAQKDQDAKATAAAMRARSELLELFSALQDAETGQRGFLIEGRQSYLAPYSAARRRLDVLFSSIDAIYVGVPESRRRLADLRTASDAKLAELQRTIDLKTAGDDRGALQIVGSDLGLNLMRRARGIVADLQDDDLRRMSERQEQARKVGQLVEAAVAASILLAIGAAGFVLNDTRRRELRLVAAIGEREAAYSALSAANERRERLEDQLRQAQKMEAVGQLTGGLAHDFNNMLAIVIGSLAMMKRRIGRGEPELVPKYIEMAMAGAERATNLTHRLLAFSRRQPLAPEVLALNKVLPGLSELLRRTLGEMIQLETVLGGGLWYTKADANQLESAIVNLAVNARDAMPDGGRLTLETANAHLDEAYAAEHVEVSAGQYVMVAVTDTGSGMDRKTINKAFDPFFTTKGVGKGTGLGLSQVYGFVKQSGGHAKIYSEPSRGTTVRLYLPRTHEAAQLATTSVRNAEAELPMGEPRFIILVVEDEDGVRRLTVDGLRDLNYTVIHASNGWDALRIFETDNPRISLLLTDVVMPELTGKQLVDKARRLRPDLKTLYMTGYTRNSIVHNGVIDPGVQLISKPFTLEQLAKKVRECIVPD